MTRRFLGFDPQLMYLMALAASEPSLRYRAGVVNIPRNHNRPPARCTLHARVSAMHVVSAYRCVCVCAQSARAGRQVAGVQLWEVQARVVCLVIFASSAPSSYSWRSLTLLKVPWRWKRLWLRSRWQRWGITGNGKCSCCTRTWTIQPTAFACHTRVHVGPELKCAFGPELQCVYQTRTTVCMLDQN